MSQVAASSALVDGPILRTLLRLAAPNVMATSITVLVGLAETFYVGVLGVVPLAALGLVFPFAMLTGMLSAGAMGGGVSSALARPLVPATRNAHSRWRCMRCSSAPSAACCTRCCS